MPIADTDILRKYSINTGPGNSTAQPDPNDSIGGFMSSTQITDGAANNFFDDVSGDENALSDVEYRCHFIHNAHASLTAQNGRLWIGGPRCTALASTDVITSNAHPFADGMAVRVEADRTGDTLPGGLSAGTTYFVRDTTANTFKLAATLGGAAINITSDGGSFSTRKFFGTDEAIAIDGTGVVTATSASAQSERVANENTAPSGESFSAPTTKATGLVVANIPAGSCIAYWIRRSANNSGAFNNDGVLIRFEFETAA